MVGIALVGELLVSQRGSGTVLLFLDFGFGGSTPVACSTADL